MSATPANKQVTLAAPFKGMVAESNFAVVPTDYPVLAENEVLVKTESISVDPYLRGALASAPVGTVLANYIIGTVVESKSALFAVGDVVTGIAEQKLYVAVPADKLRKVDLSLGLRKSLYVGALGMPGQTAYGVIKQGGFKAGDVVVVSGAAGAVGSLFGQLARVYGAKKVIGTAGGKDKCAKVVADYGFDACIDYKEHTTKETMQEALKAALGDDKPSFYVDNTGGHVTAALWDLYDRHARISVLGAIAEYNNEKPAQVESFLFHLIYRALTVKGFLVFDYVAQPGALDEFYATVPKLIADGKVKVDETVLEGIDKVPEAFVGLFKGTNTGKMVINV